METLDELLGIWPSHSELARDLGPNRKLVSVFVQRQSVPTRYWSAIIDAAQRRAVEARLRGDYNQAVRYEQVTADNLLKLSDALESARKG